MTPKEKSVRLVIEHFDHICNTNNWKSINMNPKNEPQFMAMESLSKKHAITTIDEILRLANRPDLFKMRTKRQHMNNSTVDETYVEYWKSVKQEIEKL